MRKSMFLAVSLFITTHFPTVALQPASDSVTVTFQVVVPESTPDDATIFWAGTLNSWDPGVDGSGFSATDHNLPVAKTNGIWSIQLKTTRGDTVCYKYTRGSIFSAEELADYTYREPRTVIFDRDKTVRDTVEVWHDIPPEALKHQWPVVELEPVSELDITYRGIPMKGFGTILYDRNMLGRYYDLNSWNTEVAGVPETLQNPIFYFQKVSYAPDNTILVVAGRADTDSTWNIYVDQNNDNRIDHDEFAFTTSDSLKRQKHTVEVQIQRVSDNKPFNTTVHFTITQVTDLPPGYRSSAVPGAPDLTYELPFKNRMGTLNSKTFYLNTNFGSHFKKYHQILIDYNRNDTLEMGSGSIESAALDLTQSHLQQTYYSYPNFSLGDQTWEVADVDPEGTWTRLRPSLKNIDRKAIVVGKPAPQWRATTIDGIEMSSEALQGKYVLLDFWGSWCGPCIQAIPQLKKVFERFKLQNFTIIGFAYENESSLKRAMEQYELPWPQILDNRGTYRTRFLVSGYPTYYLIDPDGTVLAMGQELRGERLVKTLEKYLE